MGCRPSDDLSSELFVRLKKTIGVICPVFNEEKAIPPFFTRIEALRAKVDDKYDLNLVFVDNCSTDETPKCIREIAVNREWVAHLRMSRNNGYQRSLECGLRSTLADLYVMIDVDCEDPPEMISDFLREYESGYEVVYGERVDRVEPVFLKWLRRQYYHLTRMAADETFNLYMAEFALITRAVRDAAIQDANSFPFFRASIARVGYAQKGIPYKRHPRLQGTTHYNIFGMIAFGLAGILSASTLLLRLTAYAFLPWFILISLLFVLGFTNENVLFFWGAVWAGFLYFGLALAGLSIYLARTYKNTLQRPNYFIDQRRSIERPFANQGSSIEPPSVTVTK